ncbi:MAG TPA: folate-binding protein YgfZ [Citreicella sp.]|jgi:tRNA-modifying protein YgfZ|uniref:CAF17-like 4Fe-4S cluster assembly/insertion protein YgfZ n=1 Tax=Salipiger marinus TaxID=555512 RepID=UPI000E9AAA4C|nr:folate-binding protein YgfZ [Citreicella sp.]HBT02601.1 folate-binding protein YgfZ [Citreicella sp.]|tara:strand:- start:671 stop:1408 length:738 start_codon:yes stop_codon:yes gene_type:complete
MTEDRTVLRVSGPEAAEFLQGLVTNDVAQLKHGLVYAAMLTAQGKYRADFFLVPQQDGSVLLDVAAALAEDLTRALSLYKLRAKVTLEPTEITVSQGTGPAPEGAFADPRHPSLGWRGYDGQPSQPADWDALRVAACVPQSGVELTPDTFILEAGFERLGGVDFRKGCYVGQEVTARMKHKTELRKGLALVEVQGSAPVGTEIMAGEKVAGTLYTQANGQGIAYLRFDRAEGEMTAGDAVLRRLP